MSRKASEAIVPENARERQILEVLNRLRSGEHLGESDSFGVLKPIATEAKGAIKHIVKTSRQEGISSDRQVIWIIAPRGGGKTEALVSIEKELLLENYEKGLNKSLVVSVDLKRASQATTGPGLQAMIFENVTTTNSSALKTQIDALAKQLTEISESEKVRENIVSLGLDVAFTLTNLPLPGASGGIASAVSFVRRKWSLREKGIQNLLRARGILAPDAINFLTRWIKYSVNPNQENWRILAQVFQPIADREILFPILCATLQQTGYSTVVLLFDEVDQLVGATNLTRAFERLWDPPRDADFYKHKLNTFFILAGTAKVADLSKEETYSGFSRRFLGSSLAPNSFYVLRRPVVKETPKYDDDCTHAMNKVKELVGDLTGRPVADLAEEHEIALRKTLAKQASEEKLTWYDLWAAICNEYYPK